MKDKIIIKGARQHILKNVDLEINKNKLTVFTGLSGSGKSSLAYDTIYAEGQRRYVESLSSYARQFLGVMDKPDVDSIEGLSPAISIDQKSSSHNPRSTVGTVTEIYDYLRLLFARIGHPHCVNCGREISRQSSGQITEKVMNLFQKENNSIKINSFMILSPVVRMRKGEFSQLFENVRGKGYHSVRIDNVVLGLDENIVLIKTNKHSIDVVIDRLTVSKKELKHKKNQEALRQRISQDIEQALSLSQGLAVISQVKDASFSFPQKPEKMDDHLYSERFACPNCNIALSEIEPRLFSFNSPSGACKKCGGIGSEMSIDPELIINKNLSIMEGGIRFFNRDISSDTWYGRLLLTAADRIGIDPKKPLKVVSEQKMDKLLYGFGDEIFQVTGENRYGKVVSIYEKFTGVVSYLEKKFSQSESKFVRQEIGKYLKEEVCQECHGKRLRKEALSISIGGKNISDITELSISKVHEWILAEQKNLNERDKIIAHMIIKEIGSRLSFLLSVGLEYLTLGRSAQSLAGGESQRIRLASQIGSGLSGVLYVLDEPSIGLHPRDNGRLIKTLKALRNLGNTVVVVEHDREMIESADFIADFGPGAGDHGGKVIVNGTLEEVKKCKDSLTGDYLSGRKKIKLHDINSDKNSAAQILEIEGCGSNNLKNISVKFPLYKLICVTGVSGSGKSTLVVDTLYHAMAKNFNPYHREKGGEYSKISGIEKIRRAILIDQSPIGRTPRSNPATYTGAFTYIRELFSQSPMAKARGYKLGRFSFNVKGGRCEACLGEGELKIEMQFLPDVYVACDVCRASRYNKETLEILFKDKNIADVLQMTVEESLNFFKNIPGLSNKLKTLNDVGLSYIRLGQPAPQLSGGEAQRVKLASELSKQTIKDTIYILDEPTTGLHFADLDKLLAVLKQLVANGNTVIIIEHNPDVIINSDWIIDLGPEGGDNGGNIVTEGSLDKIISSKSSYTGKFLKPYLK